MALIARRKYLQLATLQPNGCGYACQALFALGDDCFNVLLNTPALHGVNLKHHPEATVLIPDDATAGEAGMGPERVKFTLRPDALLPGSRAWRLGIEALSVRHGERTHRLCLLEGFSLFWLQPMGGRYIKGLKRVCSLAGRWLPGAQDATRTLRPPQLA